jgi:magnesium transporter
MFDVYLAQQDGLYRAPAGEGPPSAAVWVDLVRPTAEEEARVGEALGIAIPTREEMEEIEISSRLYGENGVHFMTATFLSQADTELPDAAPVTFILGSSCLITVRHHEPRSFQTFKTRALRPAAGYTSAERVLAGLLDAIIDRMADILERVNASVDALSREIFRYRGRGPAKQRDFQALLERIGREGDLLSMVRESLVSMGRLLSYLVLELGTSKPRREARERIKMVVRDAHDLSAHASFLADKITFLLDATLGMIQIEQNGIIKIFSVAAVVFLPPTLVASIYGMNFEIMPELDWRFGYPLAIGIMIASAAVTYAFFKRRGWL